MSWVGILYLSNTIKHNNKHKKKNIALCWGLVSTEARYNLTHTTWTQSRWSQTASQWELRRQIFLIPGNKTLWQKDTDSQTNQEPHRTICAARLHVSFGTEKCVGPYTQCSVISNCSHKNTIEKSARRASALKVKQESWTKKNFSLSSVSFTVNGAPWLTDSIDHRESLSEYRCGKCAASSQ